MAITGVPALSDLVIDFTIDPNAALLVNPVPTSRTIATIAPLTIDATRGPTDLSTDRVLAADQLTDTLDGFVPAPHSGGNTGQFLRDDIAWAVPPTFDGTDDGYVPHNPSGVQNKFLRDDATWQTSATAGVSSITATAPATRDVSTGDVTIGVSQFTQVSSGIVPASGGGTSKFLRADATWAAPANAVHLLSTGLPATIDTGSAAVSDVMYAQHFVDYASGGGPYPDHSVEVVESASASANTLVALKAFNTSWSHYPALDFKRARGVHDTPAQVQDQDLVAGIDAFSYNPDGTWTQSAGLLLGQVDGNPVNSIVDVATVLRSRYASTGNGTAMRFTATGAQIAVGSGLSGAPKSTLEVLGSLGLVPTLVSSTPYTVLDTDVLIECDASLVTPVLALYLPDPTDYTGRIIFVRRVDTTPGVQVIINSSLVGSGYIDSVTDIQLWGEHDSAVIYSDGIVWRRLFVTQNGPYTIISSPAAIANTASLTMFTTASPGSLDSYGDFRGKTRNLIRAGGKYSTTGTPTLQIICADSYDGATDVYADSGARTMPSGVTDADWTLRGEVVLDATNVPRYAGFVLEIADGSGVISSYSCRPATFATSSGSAVAIWVQWGAADPANTITLEHFSVDTKPTGDTN